MPSATGVIDGHGPLDGLLTAAPDALAVGYGVEHATLLPADADVWDLMALATGHGIDVAELAAAVAGVPVIGLGGQVPGLVAAHTGGLIDGHGQISGVLADVELAAVASGLGALGSSVVAGPLAGAAPWGAAGAVDGSFAVVPVAAVSIAYTTTTATVSIPPWVRYIDAVVLGAGGGGSRGGQGFPGWPGQGGRGGHWNATTWDRGESRNGWAKLSVTVGTGGTGGGDTGGTGGSTTIAVTGGPSITGAGGVGGSGQPDLLGTDRDGQAAQGGNAGGSTPAHLIYNGVNYPGGGPSTGDTANIPGSGGRGGGGAVWPGSPGSGRAGGRGQAWIRFWM
ncbi:hypothetical protein C6V83_18010 [Gordonia iterans]|uniref:Glycine-rich domain-containing protein n=2 Tax=Gordonia iterans TaxID=1004901 RepID=A0A2S0KJN6_9ACTN|nr:hypothetical protein C6V83_18010 [Gordonia iterans]